MAKVKYYAKENSSIGTHSFYAVPIPNGTLTFDELLAAATTTIRQAENWMDRTLGWTHPKSLARPRPLHTGDHGKHQQWCFSFC